MIFKTSSARRNSQRKRDTQRRARLAALGLCVRCGGTRNPVSKRACDKCLDAARLRYTPIGANCGRKAIPRGEA